MEVLHMILQLIAGATLIILGAAVWLARHYLWWKRVLEWVFLDKGDDLFAKDMPYSGHVRWFRYVAIPVGVTIMIPSTIAVDVVLGLIGAAAFWRMRRERAAYYAFVRQNQQAETD